MGRRWLWVSISDEKTATAVGDYGAIVRTVTAGQGE
jgi:photosystem II stability/assembly factor-like uncharacterized protein